MLQWMSTLSRLLIMYLYCSLFSGYRTCRLPRSQGIYSFASSTATGSLHSSFDIWIYFGGSLVSPSKLRINFRKGSTRSSINLNSLWSMSGTRCKKLAFGQTELSSTECWCGIRVSYIPCMKKHGHFDLLILSMLRKRSYTIADIIEPAQPKSDFAASLIDI